MNLLRRQLPVFIAFVSGLLLWARFYVPTQSSQALGDNFFMWIRIIVALASILGILAAMRHSAAIQLRKAGFAFSWVTIISFIVMTGAGLLPVRFPGLAQLQNQGAGLHQWMFDNMMLPMQSTLFATLAFFIASAAFRAFRARSTEAAALLITACIVMIGRVPAGDLLASALPHFTFAGGTSYSLLDLPKAVDWLLNVPSAAAQRGILLGVVLGQIAISVRIIFGIERTYMGVATNGLGAAHPEPRPPHHLCDRRPVRADSAAVPAGAAGGADAERARHFRRDREAAAGLTDPDFRRF